MKKCVFSCIMLLVLGLGISCSTHKKKSGSVTTPPESSPIPLTGENGEGKAISDGAGELGGGKPADTRSEIDASGSNTLNGTSEPCLKKHETLSAALSDSSFITLLKTLVAKPDSPEAQEIANAINKNKVLCSDG